MLDDSNRKPNKVWVENNKFHNTSMKSWLQDNDIKMSSIYNDGKSVRTLKNKINKYMNLVSNYVYINKLDDIAKKYNITCNITIKIKPLDISQAHILTLIKKIIREILNLKLVTTKHFCNIKTFQLKVTLQIGLNEFLWFRKLKALGRGHILIFF